MKIKIAKLLMAPWWYASCPVCKTPSAGFYSARRWWLCVVWAREHIKKHQETKQLTYAETRL